jgi:hypothetical protein
MRTGRAPWQAPFLRHTLVRAASPEHLDGNPSLPIPRAAWANYNGRQLPCQGVQVSNLSGCLGTPRSSSSQTMLP